ncbi:DICT sensory domain-containing protein [Natrialba sp. INN-245]|uniref:DICT sensory domain-containing protein n=1 Tax=Natrialba sp. INN-245 TaxID=2690967 RepID=UPI0013122DDB|nr:DICT sensory domain-containing protein [Natrialba sp. INN-245]MWV40600.1 histidine kinase [Natrialba sp. INN-245]
MMGLRDTIDAVERRRKRLEVYTDDPEIADELATQFETRNVDVSHRSLGALDVTGFVVVRSGDGEFRGALGIEQFDAILSPEINPLWELTDATVEPDELFDFFENTVFSAYDRRQMLTAAREIEERAWRVGGGTLYVGFQRRDALADQKDVYERLATRRSVTVTVFIDDEWDDPFDDVTVVTDAGGEIGDVWFLVFDGAENALQKCALVAEQRGPDRYYGFWTYDPEIVDDLLDDLESTYGFG